VELFLDLKIVRRKMYRGVKVLPHTFLTWTVDGREWSATYTSHFPSAGSSACYPLDRRLGATASRADVDDVLRRKMSLPCQTSGHLY
jgi:hypothetical protein